ncbi:MAG: LamG-like jellyroll fold domain-containing protein [Hydrogenophaga sp.]|uniref:LamG-like jellyroll fold domain-containing protein n=1 Tax=Hydrogenophaga sp. TaxID=1904254 RepID=UPI004035B144
MAESAARILFGDGSVRAFSWDVTSSTYKPSNSADLLTLNATGLLYQRLDDDSRWQFDAAGRLQTVTQRNGWVTSYSYIAGSSRGGAPAVSLLTEVTNQFGRTFRFTYNATDQLVSVSTPEGRVISYEYDGTTTTARLTTVTYPANTGTVTRTYLYENTTFAQLVTGIIDETGNRLASYTYDSEGRAITSGQAGGVDLYSVAYPVSTGAPTTVTDPLGTQRTYNYGTSIGKLVVTGADKLSGTGGSAVASRVQDANGFVTQETDFLGVNTTYTWDTDRRLPLTTTTAAGLPEAQTVTTQWHATHRLPLLVTEPGRSTAYTYDALGNMLTRTVTDTATSASRTSTWTYNAAGQVLTAKGPRTDIDDTAVYAYYNSSTDFIDHSIGSDPSFDAVSLLLHGDGANGAVSFIDDSRNHWTVTPNGNAQISTAQSKFGGASMSFDGAGDYITIADSPGFTLGTGDFTLEFWVRFNNVGVDQYIAGQVNSAFTNTTLSLAINRGVANKITSVIGVGSSLVIVPGAVSVTTGTWYHVALVRSGSLFSQYLNGVADGTATHVGPVNDSNEAWAIGRPGAYPLLDFNGYVDDFRLTKGVARYTANFTPPTQAFSNVVSPVTDPEAVGHTTGDLASVTNAAGHVTQFTQYDAAGRVRQMVDPKGVVTDIAYTPRGWVSEIAVTPPGGSARTTSYGYDAVGQLTGVTQPDGSSLSYSYDAAQRLVGVTDAKGNSVSYTLDNMGNRVSEEVKDPGGVLRRTIARSFDALNRLQQVTGSVQ